VDNLAPRDVEALAEALGAYHARFAPLFQRAEQRHWARKYLEGQLLELERKSIEPMALALDGGDGDAVQGMQQFIGVGAWDADAVLHAHQRCVAETLGDPATGVLILDGCDFPKQGTHSVGVARQWCGALGKVANCQASVVACYASARGFTLVDRRLFLPEGWFSADYEARWQDCGIPDDTPARTKPALAADLIETLHTRGELPFRWVTADEGFGKDPAFLDRVDRLGLGYFVEVPRNTPIWAARPPTAVPPGTGKGRPPTRERVGPGEPPAVRVDQVAAAVPADQWTRQRIKEGAKGPLVAEFAAVRAVASRDGLPGPDVWVVCRRSLPDPDDADAVPVLKYYLSNAPGTTPLTAFVWLSGMRWPVETAILEAKNELGLDHYEVRGWTGWHHHTALTFLAHHFLVTARLQVGGKITGGDRAPSAPALGGHPAQTHVRRRGRPRPHPAAPAPELRRLLLPSPPHPAPPGYLLTI
jgi:SRSO17 transposase